MNNEIHRFQCASMQPYTWQRVKFNEEQIFQTSMSKMEFWRPSFLEINCTIYRVIGPGLTTDNFIIQTSDLIVRIDVGVSEGDNVLRVVAATPKMGVFYDSDGKAFGGL